MLIAYSYGKRNKCFCFDPNAQVADMYHASIHILGITIYRQIPKLRTLVLDFGIFGNDVKC